MTERVLITDDLSSSPFEMPVVVKPADSQGQRGTTIVHGESELHSSLTKAFQASRSGRVLIERYVKGPEFTMNAWMHQGELALLMINDRITYNPWPYIGIAFQHRFPSMAVENRERVVGLTRAIAGSYGVHTGPLYIQAIQSESGPQVVEAAARVGGGHESRMVLRLTGWNSDDALIDLALGETPGEPKPLPDNAHMLVNFILGSAGVVASCPPFDFGPEIVEGGWYVKPRDQLADVTDSLGRVGYFIATSTSAAELTYKAADYYRTLTLPTSSGANLVQQPDLELLNLP
jgi:carbamoylphosphate synthase large subunit